MKRLLFLILIGLAVAVPGFPEDHHDRSPADIFQVSPLPGSVYALYGRGGNVGFYVGPDAVFVVDSQYQDVAPGILDQIRKITDRPVKYLLNTHHHADHVGGNPVFRPFSLNIAHDNVRKRMLASPAEILRDYPGEMEKARKAGDAKGEKFYADQIEWARKVKVEEIAAPFLTFDSEFRLHLGEEVIQVWHTPPGHTDGDSVAYFEKARVLHGGDLVWNRVIPFIDVKGGGSPKGHAAALDEIIRRLPSDVKVIPGHGQVMDLEGLKAFRRYFADLLEAAGKAKSAGVPREEFLKTVDLPAYRDYSGYASRFKDNCAAAYDEAP
jgi:glyoxylase-like metal-dependent hydrolase (beta-lactamase superfamily II)